MTDSLFTDEMLNNIKEHPALWVDLDVDPVAYNGVNPPLPIGKIRKYKNQFILTDSRTGETMATGITMHDTLSKWAENELIRRESSSHQE